MIEGSYDEAFILGNPIDAWCKKCRRQFTDTNGEGAIRAPSLENVRCFYCWGELRPLDAVSYRLRLKELPQHLAKGQIELFA